MSLRKILKYEFLNIMRNRWVFACALLVAALMMTLQKISGDFRKTMLTLASLMVVFAPLVTCFFTSLYWYHSERFTQLIATMPVHRRVIFHSRYVAIVVSLSLCFASGILAGAALAGSIDGGVLLLAGISVLLVAVFSGLALWISASCGDRMLGIGLVFALWLYFVLVHDGLLLLALVTLREYPMDLAAGALGALSPIGLARVVLLMHNEGSLLLGHTGALVREILSSWRGSALAAAASLFWIALPLGLGARAFQRKDL